jgi:hypothetical protein
MMHPDADRVSVAGRDTPRPSGPPVAHEIRYAPFLVIDVKGTHPAILADCACGDYAQVMREPYYTHEQLTRLAVMHETGQAP